MNDPHVVTLKYRVLETDSFEFQDPPDINIDTPYFRGRLSKYILILEPKEHYESEIQIRPIADKFLHSWEIAAGLQYGRPNFRIRFEGSQIMDRKPSQGEQSVHINSCLHSSGSLQAKPIYRAYPTPPEEFQVTPEVEVLWDRYCRFLDGKEPLLSMAYFCLTLLERGDRKQAALHYGIDSKVLNKLGELTSTRGDNTTARKLTVTTSQLSNIEQTWIESTIKAVIKHLATIKPGQILKMTDLPQLT